MKSRAVLFFGWFWSEPADHPIIDGEWRLHDWIDSVMVKRGDSPPPWPDTIDQIDDMDAWQAAGAAWCESEDVLAYSAHAKAVLAQIGDVNVDSMREHGEDTGAYAYVVRHISEGWGHGEDLDLPEITQDMVDALERWIDAMGLDRPHEKPRWWLISEYR